MKIAKSITDSLVKITFIVGAVATVVVPCICATKLGLELFKATDES